MFEGIDLVKNHGVMLESQPLSLRSILQGLAKNYHIQQFSCCSKHNIKFDSYPKILYVVMQVAI